MTEENANKSDAATGNAGISAADIEKILAKASAPANDAIKSFSSSFENFSKAMTEKQAEAPKAKAADTREAMQALVDNLDPDERKVLKAAIQLETEETMSKVLSQFEDKFKKELSDLRPSVVNDALDRIKKEDEVNSIQARVIEMYPDISNDGELRTKAKELAQNFTEDQRKDPKIFELIVKAAASEIGVQPRKLGKPTLINASYPSGHSGEAETKKMSDKELDILASHFNIKNKKALL